MHTYIYIYVCRLGHATQKLVGVAEHGENIIGEQRCKTTRLAYHRERIRIYLDAHVYHIYVCVQIHVHIIHIQRYALCVLSYLYIHDYTCMIVYIHTYTYIHIHTYICTSIYICIYIHLHMIVGCNSRSGPDATHLFHPRFPVVKLPLGISSDTDLGCVLVFNNQFSEPMLT